METAATVETSSDLTLYYTCIIFVNKNITSLRQVKNVTLCLGIARAPDDHADLGRKAAVTLFAVAGRGGRRAARLGLHLMHRGLGRGGGDGLVGQLL